MRVANKYLSLMKFVNIVVLRFTSILLMIIFIALVSQVFFRYVLNSSLSWTDELARYLMVWVIFLGTSLGLRNRSLIAVEAIVQFVPEKIRNIFRIFVLLLSLVFCAYLVFYGVIAADSVSSQNSIALDIPMWIPYLAVPVGGAYTILNILVVMIEVFTEEGEEIV